MARSSAVKTRVMPFRFASVALSSRCVISRSRASSLWSTAADMPTVPVSGAGWPAGAGVLADAAGTLAVVVVAVDTAAVVAVLFAGSAVPFGGVWFAA